MAMNAVVTGAAAGREWRHGRALADRGRHLHNSGLPRSCRRGVAFDAAGAAYLAGGYGGALEPFPAAPATYWTVEFSSAAPAALPGGLFAMPSPRRQVRYDVRSAAYLLVLPPP